MSIKQFVDKYEPYLFDLDEDALKYGVIAEDGFVVDFLGAKKKKRKRDTPLRFLRGGCPLNWLKKAEQRVRVL